MLAITCVRSSWVDALFKVLITTDPRLYVCIVEVGKTDNGFNCGKSFADDNAPPLCPKTPTGATTCNTTGTTGISGNTGAEVQAAQAREQLEAQTS